MHAQGPVPVARRVPGTVGPLRVPGLRGTARSDRSRDQPRGDRYPVRGRDARVLSPPGQARRRTAVADADGRERARVAGLESRHHARGSARPHRASPDVPQPGSAPARGPVPDHAAPRCGGRPVRDAGRWRVARGVERMRGQQMFESYLHKRVDPALLEQDHANGFSARVFPIPASGDKDIIIAYDHRISAADPYQLTLRGLPKTQHLAIAITSNGATTTRDLANQVPDDVVVPIGQGDAAVAAGDLFVARIDHTTTTTQKPHDRVMILVDTSASRAPIM